MFVVWSPAADLTGTPGLLMLSLLLVTIVAARHAYSSAITAVPYPSAGGTYVCRTSVTCTSCGHGGTPEYAAWRFAGPAGDGPRRAGARAAGDRWRTARLGIGWYALRGRVTMRQ